MYIHKTGNNDNEKKKTCVFSVKELRSYIQKNAEAERENLAHLKDLDELEICYDGDGGGGRFVCEFAFINNIDRKITLHPFLIYEGTDCRENLEVTLGKLTPQFKQIEGEEGGGVVVGGPEVGRPALDNTTTSSFSNFSPASISYRHLDNNTLDSCSTQGN